MRERLARVAIWGGLAIFTVTLLGADGGSISGNVTTTDGTGIAAALTLHDLSTVRMVGSHAFDYQFSSKKNGNFALTGIPRGKYEICVDAPPHKAVLDPCEWGNTQKFDVAAGQETSPIDLTVEQGYLLQVRIDDPAQLLPNLPGGIPGPALLLGVQTKKGRFENLRLNTNDATGRDQYLVIPYDKALTLVASAGPGIALSDSNNKRYSGDTVSIPITVATGASLPLIKLKVSKP